MSDYISRDMAIVIINAVIEGDESPEVLEALNRVHKNIETLSAEDVVPVVHGLWIEDEYDVYCSVCKCAYPKDTEIADWRKISAFCDNCGAQMDEE